MRLCAISARFLETTGCALNGASSLIRMNTVYVAKPLARSGIQRNKTQIKVHIDLL